MLKLERIHHIAIVCSDYKKSLNFYTNILGLKLEHEVYRESRKSFKADLSLNGSYIIELFSFPNPPARTSRPEATGLRHLAFQVNDIDETVKMLGNYGLTAEPVRIDEYTGKRFTFINHPDDLPIEFYEG